MFKELFYSQLQIIPETKKTTTQSACDVWFTKYRPKQIANKAAGRSLDAGKPGARGQATFTGQGEAGRPVSTRRLRRASKDRDVLPHRKSRVTMPVPGA
jgi:uncharacterized protein YcfJ